MIRLVLADIRDALSMLWHGFLGVVTAEYCDQPEEHR